MNTKKIIHIEDFFHPDAGYQVNILAKYMAKQFYDVYILTSELEKTPKYLTDFFSKEDIELKDREYEKKYGVHIIRLPLHGYISGRAVYKKVIWKKIEEINPDIIYVHGCDTYMGILVLKRAARLGRRIITDNHMVDVASKNPFRNIFRFYYRNRIAPIIVKNNIPVIRLQDVDYVSRWLGIPIENAPLISHGSDTMLFYPDPDKKSKLRKKYNIPYDARVVCYVGKLDEYKGGLILAEAIKKNIKSKKDLVFVIVGSTSGEYGDKVERAFDSSENRILRFPTQKYEDLAGFYQMSDIAVFPKACSMSFFDVQACGLPVISEKFDLNIERCSHGNGINFEMDNAEALMDAIQVMAALDDDELKKMQQNAVDFIKSKYDYNDILKEYINLIERTD